MTNEYQFDIIVIGAGSGGLNVAGFMNKAGFKTLLVEKDEENIGGDCLNTGCVPSKALIHTARLVHSARETESFGLNSSGGVDLGKVKNYIDERRGLIEKHENKKYFESIGMSVVIGEARFTGKNSVEVAGLEYTAKKIVLASGSRPRPLEIAGSENVEILTNETVFELSQLPEKFVIIGGGPIGMEIGQAYARLGSEVTILERGEQFLPKEDPEITEVLRARLEEEGVEIIFESEAKRFEGTSVLIYEKDGREQSIEFSQILASVGRVTKFDDMDLEKAGIKLNERGKLITDKSLRTTNKNVSAVGDVVGGFQFTHAAEMHARVVISNFFSPFKKKFRPENIAWVTYTDPQIATFGRQEKELKEQNISYEVIETDFEDEDRAIVDNERKGLVKIFVSKDKILGGTMVGASAGELVQELILAQQANVPVSKVFEKTYPYPTATRINRKAISEHQAKKLTPRVKKILRLAYKIFS